MNQKGQISGDMLISLSMLAAIFITIFFILNFIEDMSSTPHTVEEWVCSKEKGTGIFEKACLRTHTSCFDGTCTTNCVEFDENNFIEKKECVEWVWKKRYRPCLFGKIDSSGNHICLQYEKVKE